MSGLTPAQAMTRPLSAPPTIPTAIGSEQASPTLRMVGSRWAKMPDSMPATASSEPTERSMPAVRIVKVMPMEMIPITETCSRISRPFSADRNCGTATEKYATRPASAK